MTKTSSQRSFRQFNVRLSLIFFQFVNETTVFFSFSLRLFVSFLFLHGHAVDMMNE